MAEAPSIMPAQSEKKESIIGKSIGKIKETGAVLSYSFTFSFVLMKAFLTTLYSCFMLCCEREAIQILGSVNWPMLTGFGPEVDSRPGFTYLLPIAS